jgi:alkylation response protein AidB-like acyl-CoA dehydrogenase
MAGAARRSRAKESVMIGPEDSPREAAFRAEVRAWLEANARPRRVGGNWSDGPTDHGVQAEQAHLERCRAWQRTKFDGGFAAISWPRRYGGRDGSPVEELIYREEESRFDVTNGFLMASIALVGPALLVHGDEAQRERFLRPLLRGDEVWCQLFSEPEAGSDLARLGTRGELRGDELIVTGQKIWTSGAQHADWGFLLLRTNPDALKHDGISFALIDMRQPGIEVRPLVTMSRDRHFNEVFFDGARVPLANVVKGIDRGWAVARTTLANESVMIGSGAARGEGVERILALARQRGTLADPVLRQELAEAWIDERVLEFFRRRMTEALRAGERPDLDGSVMKVFWSESRDFRMNIGLRALGADALLDLEDAPEHGGWQQRVLSFPIGSVGGGTHEVHRNGIGERALGLPKEERADRAMTFRELREHDARLGKRQG